MVTSGQSELIADIERCVSSWSGRSSWDEYFMMLALLVSSRSPSPKLKVGSVIVKSNRVVSSGYNGFLAGVPHVSITRDGHEVNTIHSEQNAISDAAKRGISIDESTLYVTHYPCINCCKYLISAGVKELKYHFDYHNDELVAQMLEQAQVSVSKI